MWRTLGTGIVLCSVVVGGLLAQDASNAAVDKPRKAAAGRLPPNYAKLDLSGTQRDQIYSVQNKYKVELEQLQAQLDSARTRRDAEIEAVLTAEQRQKLGVLQAEARKKADSKKTSKPASEASKADPTAGSTPKSE